VSTPWNLSPGIEQARAQTVGFVPDGDWAFCLGRDFTGHEAFFRVGDGASIAQTADIDPTVLLTFKARVRGPTIVPVDAVWVAQVELGGFLLGSWTLEDHKTLDLNDAVFNVTSINGVVELKFSLVLEGTNPGDVLTDVPAFYVDSITFDEIGGGYEVLNRDPAPNEIQVPLDTNIKFDISDSSGSVPDLAATQVFVDGILAFDGGVFQPGWNGPNSSAVFTFPEVLTIVIDPVVDFGPEQTVVVQVLSANVGNVLQIDAIWEFVTLDLIAPIPIQAEALSKLVVRLVYDENVLQDESGGSALNPANYTITTETIPAVPLVVVQVLPVNGFTVDLITDIEHTPGALYTVHIQNVEDLFFNAIVDEEIDFVGYTPPKPEGREFLIWPWIPCKNKHDDVTGELRRYIDCLQEVLDLWLCLVDEWAAIYDPDLAPLKFVNAMLDDLGNPFSFVSKFDQLQKANLVKILVELYKLKGTCIGIMNAVLFLLGLEVVCEAANTPELYWILGESELDIETLLGPDAQFTIYSFKLISPIFLTDEQKANIEEICEYMKPAHTHCLGVEEPDIPQPPPDHWELGVSLLSLETLLH